MGGGEGEFGLGLGSRKFLHGAGEAVFRMGTDVCGEGVK